MIESAFESISERALDALADELFQGYDVEEAGRDDSEPWRRLA